MGINCGVPSKRRRREAGGIAARAALPQIMEHRCRPQCATIESQNPLQRWTSGIKWSGSIPGCTAAFHYRAIPGPALGPRETSHEVKSQAASWRGGGNARCSL